MALTPPGMTPQMMEQLLLQQRQGGAAQNMPYVPPQGGLPGGNPAQNLPYSPNGADPALMQQLLEQGQGLKVAGQPMTPMTAPDPSQGAPKQAPMYNKGAAGGGGGGGAAGLAGDIIGAGMQVYGGYKDERAQNQRDKKARSVLRSKENKKYDIATDSPLQTMMTPIGDMTKHQFAQSDPTSGPGMQVIAAAGQTAAGMANPAQGGMLGNASREQQTAFVVQGILNTLIPMALSTPIKSMMDDKGAINQALNKFKTPLTPRGIYPGGHAERKIQRDKEREERKKKKNKKKKFTPKRAATAVATAGASEAYEASQGHGWGAFG